MRETILETPRMSLYYHPRQKVIHHEMHSYPGLDILERVLLKGLEVMKLHSAHKWLSDDRNGGALPKSHHDWGDTEWAPQAAKLGWKHWAVVLPDNLLHNANMSKLVERYAARGVVARIFNDPGEAFRWLTLQTAR